MKKKYGRGGIATPPPESRGTLGHPSRASPAKGKAVFRRYVESVLEILQMDEEPGGGG
jgi:creatinine amidohydrolase/Fe(II)-dependent formamide hydrolase-like protein